MYYPRSPNMSMDNLIMNNLTMTHAYLNPYPNSLAPNLTFTLTANHFKHTGRVSLISCRAPSFIG